MFANSYSFRKFRFFLRILKVLCAFLFVMLQNILFFLGLLLFVSV